MAIICIILSKILALTTAAKNLTREVLMLNLTIQNKYSVKSHKYPLISSNITDV